VTLLIWEPKQWWKSKANWTAIATFIGGAVPLFLATNTGLIGDSLALQITGFTAGISAILQFAIRTFWTSEPIAAKPTELPPIDPPSP
jgi:hypothetical protein